MTTLIALLLGIVIGWAVPQPLWVKDLFSKFWEWISQ